MVEAAMVLPIFILIVFTLMLVMVHDYTVHHGQIALHREMLYQMQESDVFYKVQKQTQRNQTRLDGMVNHLLKTEKQHRVYCMKPARWILLGVMAGLDDG